MTISIIKTYEISESLWEEIVIRFNESFPNQYSDKKKLYEWYVSNKYGYSFHALCTIEDKLVGFNSFIPFEYKIGEHNVNIVYSGSTFVIKEHRNNVTILFEIFKKMNEYCQNNKISAILAIPNNNSYLYFTKFLRFHNPFNLDYYLLPVKFFSFTKNKFLKIFNVFSVAAFYSYSYFQLLLSELFNYKEKQVICRMSIDSETLETRFNASHYVTKTNKDIRFTYTIAIDDGLRVAYIMDFREKSIRTTKALAYCVWNIIKNEKIDAVMFVGIMNLKQFSLFRLPNRFQPRSLHFTFKLIDPGYLNMENDLKKKNNWDFSLMNFDVR